MSVSRSAVPALIKRLVRRSHALRYKDAEKALDFAQAALLAVNTCSSRAIGSEKRLADLRGLVLGQFGNSLRLCSRLPESTEALSEAGANLAAGTGDPLLRGRFLEQLGSFHMFQRQFVPAIEAADEAQEIYRDLRDATSQASTLVQKAAILLYAGKPGIGIDLLHRAISLVDPEHDPYLLFAAQHNLVQCFLDHDQPRETLAQYHKLREIGRKFSDPLILLRTKWQEGLLLRDLGHLRQAEAALLESRRGFGERRMVYEVAVVSLDLALVYEGLGLLEALQQTIIETVPIFRALKIGRETLASLLQLQKATELRLALLT
jgi:tetratricopeptide (TPR) repeat protein